MRDSSRSYNRRPAADRKTRITLVVFVVLALIVAVGGFVIARSLFSNWTMTGLGGPNLNNITDPNKFPDLLPSDAPAEPLQIEGTGPEAPPWDGNTRVTMLVMGLDYRTCDEEQNFANCDTNTASRTDSMMLVTVDPATKTAGMLSIPRDLWVNIPGFDYAKINTAYFLGEANRMPGGGPALAMKTVEGVLGVPIQYYAQIDFDAFVKIIDAMGGLDMHIREEIIVDPIGPGNTRKLEPGVQTLDGATVLAYARNRYTEGGDTDRAKRQQEVILAVRDQILTFNMLPTLISKAPAMARQLSDGIRTNLTLKQIVQLSVLMTQIPAENIQRGVIGPPNMVVFDTSPDGQSIEIPVPDQIRILRDEIFSTGGAIAPLAEATAGASNSEESQAAALAKEEAARIQVLNGSQTEGLATRTAEYLRNQGLNVVNEGNADQAFSQSTIIDYTGKPYTARYLVDLLGVDGSRVVSRFDPNSQIDVEVILGSMFASNNPLP